MTAGSAVLARAAESRLQPQSKNPGATPAPTGRLDVALVVCVAFALYAVNVDFILSGDAAMYADYVLLRKFDELTLHLGYYSVLFVADGIGRLFGVPIYETSAWLNVVVGAATTGVAFLLARIYLGTRRDALICAAVFGFSGRVLNNATSSEMYMLQTFLVLSSYYLFLRERYYATGVVAACSLLVSPLSVFALAYFPVVEYARWRRIRLGVAARVLTAGCAVYVPFLVVDGHEMLWGVRGILRIHNQDPFDVAEMLRNFPKYEFKTFSALLLLLIPALGAARFHRPLLVATLAVFVPHLYPILKLTGEDHVFILNTDFFVACWIVIGWRWLSDSGRLRWCGPLLFATHVVLLTVAGTIFEFDSHRHYADEMRSIARTYLVGKDAAMVTDWTTANTLTFYGRERPTTVLRDEPLFAQMSNIEDFASIGPTASRARDLYLLESWRPSGLDRLLRPARSFDAQRAQYSVRGRARRLGLACDVPVHQGTVTVYRCSRPTAGT